MNSKFCRVFLFNSQVLLMFRRKFQNLRMPRAFHAAIKKPLQNKNPSNERAKSARCPLTIVLSFQFPWEKFSTIFGSVRNVVFMTFRNYVSKSRLRFPQKSIPRADKNIFILMFWKCFKWHWNEGNKIKLVPLTFPKHLLFINSNNMFSQWESLSYIMSFRLFL